MATLQDLLAQKEALDREIEEVTVKAREEALARVRLLMAEGNLTIADLGGSGKVSKAGKPAKAKVAAKYRDPESGDAWSGRGLQPRWLKAALKDGKKLADFTV